MPGSSLSCRLISCLGLSAYLCSYTACGDGGQMDEDGTTAGHTDGENGADSAADSTGKSSATGSASSGGATTGDAGEDSGNDKTTDASVTDGDPCSGISCHNDGICRAGVCECPDGYDPETKCASCSSTHVLIEWVCVRDQCQNDPCHIENAGFGDSCTLTDEGDYTCTCDADRTPESGCTECPAGQTDVGGRCMAEYCAGDINFESSAIEAAVEAALEMPGPLTVDDVAELTELRIESAGIGSLRGVDCLRNLTYFELTAENSVSDPLPLTRLANLATVIVHDGNIRNLSPFASMPQLRHLDLSGHGISDLTSVAQLERLESLIVDDNQISDLTALEDLDDLSILGLSSNRVTDLSILAGLSGLEELRLSNNPVGDLSMLADLDELRALELAGLGLADLSAVPGGRTYSRLDLSDNAISDLGAFAGGLQAWELRLDDNQISALAPLAAADTMNLSLANNQIVDISVFQADAMPSRLVLSGNQIADPTPLVAQAASKELIDLRDNAIDCSASAQSIANLRAALPSPDALLSDCP